MARERFNLISDQEKEVQDLRTAIKEGVITKENFEKYDTATQEKIKNILFEISTENIDANEGASTLEFILMSFLRIAMKKMDGEPLEAEDLIIEDELRTIMRLHDITNGTARSQWLFDYMSYAQYKTSQFLSNRKEHIERKKNVTGQA